MSRAVPLLGAPEGINLLRTKGGASANGLFDLVNAWVTPKRTINARPGAVKVLSFPIGTKGVVAFEGLHHTFTSIDAPYNDTRMVVHILKRSDNSQSTIKTIHRAFPFLGRIYVVAEFNDGVTKHFWCETPSAWKANTVYKIGAKVRPTNANGFFYVIEDSDNTAAWQANTNVTLGDFKQPTTANGFKYELTAVAGTGPYRTSNTEPKWPTVNGQTVTERRYLTNGQIAPGIGTPNPPTGDNSDTTTEYGPFPPGTKETRNSTV